MPTVEDAPLKQLHDPLLRRALLNRKVSVDGTCAGLGWMSLGIREMSGAKGGFLCTKVRDAACRGTSVIRSTTLNLCMIQSCECLELR